MYLRAKHVQPVGVSVFSLATTRAFFYNYLETYTVARSCFRRFHPNIFIMTPVTRFCLKSATVSRLNSR